MFYPPTTPLLPLHDPPINGPGYDVPPAVHRLAAPLARCVACSPRSADGSPFLRERPAR